MKHTAIRPGAEGLQEDALGPWGVRFYPRLDVPRNAQHPSGLLGKEKPHLLAGGRVSEQ